MVDIQVPQAKQANNQIRVLIVDDHAILRDSMRALFDSYSDIKIIGEASDSGQALDKVQELNPDVIVMDLSLPGMDGAEVIRRIVKQNPKTRVLVLTQFCDRDHIISSIKAGASGYIPKQASGSEVIAAIRTVYRGDCYLFPPAASTLVHDYLLHQSEDDPYDRLTNREKEILRMVVEGQTSRQIADRLSISLKTVLTHRDRMMKKLALHNRTDLIKYAIRKGLVKMD